MNTSVDQSDSIEERKDYSVEYSRILIYSGRSIRMNNFSIILLKITKKFKSLMITDMSKMGTKEADITPIAK